MHFRILGYGAFGQALAKMFQKNILLEDSLANNFKNIEQTDILIPAVPSCAVEEVVKKALAFGKPEAIMLVSKGLASDKLLTEELKHLSLPVLFLSGPNLAQEIEKDTHLLSVTIAGKKEITSKIAKFLYPIIVDETDDLILPQVAGIVKNITAFVIGYIKPSENARATLIMQGIKESCALAKNLGSNEKNFLRACIADFILTCTCENSRNFIAGKDFEKNKLANETQESLQSAKYICELKKNQNSPIIDFFYNLVIKNDKNFPLFQKIAAYEYKQN